MVCRLKCPRFLEPLSLRHSEMDDFTNSPCFNNPFVLCVFRAIAAVYLISWWLFNLSANMENGKMFIYFTNISFTLISFHFIYGFNLSCIAIKLKRDELSRADKQTTKKPSSSKSAASKRKKKQLSISKSEENETTITEIVITEVDDNQSLLIRNLPCSPTIETKRDVYMFSSLPLVESIHEDIEEPSSSSERRFSEIPETSSALPVCYQIYWLLFYISSNSSVLLTLGYYHEILEDNSSLYNSITKHVITSSLIAMEFLLSRIPICLTHVVYPVSFGALYYLFTVIYWSAGGTDSNGRAFIYDIMDYNASSSAYVIVPSMTICLVQPLIHLGFYIIAFLRNWLDGKLCRNSMSFR